MRAGQRHTADSRLRISLGKKGHRHSEDTKLKMSKAHKGKTFSAETRRKIGDVHRGKIVSEATLLKMSEAAKRQFSGRLGNGWKGDDAGYRALHIWVGRRKEKTGKCSTCSHVGKTEWANISGIYLRDLDDFGEMCKPCHNEFDSMEMG